MKSLVQVEMKHRNEIVATWYERYKTPLAQYLLRLVGDDEQASDLLHDTFVRAFSALKPNAPPDNPYAWLYRIATNQALNAFRRQNRLRWLPLTGRERTPDLESAVVNAETIRRCIAQLSPRDAEALLLYEYAGLTCVEIAAIGDEEPQTVRVRVWRARERFRKLYEKEG